MDRLVRRASSVLGCPLDSVEVVGNGRMTAKLSSLLNNTSPSTGHSDSSGQLLQHCKRVKKSGKMNMSTTSPASFPKIISETPVIAVYHASPGIAGAPKKRMVYVRRLQAEPTTVLKKEWPLAWTGGFWGYEFKYETKEEDHRPAKRVRLETPDETGVSLDNSSFRSAVWQSHSSASGRMYFRANVEYNGPDHPKDFVLQCFNSECGVFRYDTQYPICDMGGPDAFRDRKDHIPVSYLQGVGSRTASYNLNTSTQNKKRHGYPLKHTPSEMALQLHLALGGPPYPARGFTLTRH
ncbi:hypothetical protein L3Q82_021006 [Scortum barcoo]|uniref:Uncharacterized protein n=1 Tax=Scortum barcoo TaxID=214431 RepID=A0ACB8X391_9TELE|nr:hypothetical protein L3Q82_021006 [Scortum barcoo]